ncbi:MAG: hypothetical protein EZS28_037386 [Streblomastix strix]|uniref:Uncharacterized protein n=1 Tax=Streblomastix strix TaxID=222440 RepID=A0A5J4U9P8_9EUKA|nr:MAG: hypothetical protein EZS28_037386 [Streblomastix strix]
MNSQSENVGNAQTTAITVSSSPFAELRAFHRTILSHWLPLAHCVLDCVIDLIPNPNQAQWARLKKIIGIGPDESTNNYNYLNNQITVAYVSKLFVGSRDVEIGEHSMIIDKTTASLNRAIASPQSSTSDQLSNAATAAADQAARNDRFVAFTRVYCGTLHVGDRIFVLKEVIILRMQELLINKLGNKQYIQNGRSPNSQEFV